MHPTLCLVFHWAHGVQSSVEDAFTILQTHCAFLQELQHMSMDNLREKVDVVTGLYMDLLKVEGELHQLFKFVNQLCNPATSNLLTLYTDPSNPVSRVLAILTCMAMYMKLFAGHIA